MYKLAIDQSTGTLSDYVQKITNDGSFIFVHIGLDAEYLKWLAEGNVPLSADQPDQGGV